MPGDAPLTDTYLAALQHDLVELDPETTPVGVVRQPTRWFYGIVAENVPELAPPETLLDSFKKRQESLKQQGICDEESHNAAWTELDFERHYRDYLETDPSAQSAIEALRKRLTTGESIALVCYENTDAKRCHRTILRDYLSDQE
jgi:uncharacterized protein YeaO (DUF488 family)